MKNSNHNRFFIPFLGKSALALLGALGLVSCGIQTGYTETDGIYYDPSSDKIEQRVAFYDGNDGYYEEPSPGIIYQSKRNEELQNSRYSGKTWDNNSPKASSNWGYNTGNQVNTYYNSFVNPYYNFYSPYYFGNYWGSSFGFSWGSPWSYGYYNRPYSYYNPYVGYNDFYYGSYYSPWSYTPFYSPYYGSYYNRGYYGRNYHYSTPYYAPSVNYRRSGADAIYRGNIPYGNSSNGSWGRNREGWGQVPPRTNNSGFEQKSNYGRYNQTTPTRTQGNSWGNQSNEYRSNSNFGRGSNWGGSAPSNSGNWGRGSSSSSSSSGDRGFRAR